MPTRHRILRATIMVVVLLIGGCGFVYFLGSLVLRPSWVSVVTRSGFPRDDVGIVSRPAYHACAELPGGQTYTATVAPLDSQPVQVRFKCQGKERVLQDGGNIGAYGEQRTVTVLAGGDSVEVDFGSGLKDVYPTLPGG